MCLSGPPTRWRCRGKTSFCPDVANLTEREMITKSEFIIENTAYAKYKDLFDLNLELINIVNSTLDEFDKKAIKPEMDLKGVVLAIFTKSCALFVSVHHLCNLGFGLEACILVRALLEDVIDLKYLDKNNSTLCKMFFEDPNKYKNHNKIYEKAKIAEMEKHYNRWYKDLSRVFHPDYRGISPRISISQGFLLCDIGPSLNHLKEPLLLSRYYFNVAFHYFCRSFELLDEEVLESSEKDLHKFEEMTLST